jgi:hypothetical protein
MIPPGYCNYQNILEEGLSFAPPAGGISVELGVLFGQSTYYVDRWIRANKREFHKHYGIDLWKFECPSEMIGVGDGTDSSFINKYTLDDIGPYLHFMNTYAVPLKLYETTAFIKSDTSRASHIFDDNSVDFIFIDADHSYDGFKRDVLSWWNKCKIGGLFAGHDADWPGVRQAIDELFPGTWIADGTSWKVYKTSEDLLVN